ncbi:hypothetical protein [Psychroserpens sp. Hel_I_66]|uniref:hypothetical protein n=1 Tax=Psychroserpens sp. Hel_I_66 TaxID=1250004 RepID=UPI0006464FCB|nr:hypothetical protein [Psychroserpens sp. Hel_I_66]
MRKTIYVATLLGILASCKQKTEPQQAESKPIEIPAWQIDLDTIVERNNPKSLDLSKHQLFIDTTRNSEFYSKLISWEPQNEKNDVMDFYRNTLSKNKTLNEIDLQNFPTLWTTIRKLNGEFILYQRCDGIDKRIEITKNAIYFYGPLESHADAINQLIRLSDEDIKIELKAKRQNGEKNAMFSITKTEHENIYYLQYYSENGLFQELIIPTNKASEFDLIVNNCVQMKRTEFKGFDRIEYNE